MAAYSTILTKTICSDMGCISGGRSATRNLSDVRLVHANNRSIEQLRHESIIESGSRTPESVPVSVTSPRSVHQPERLPLRSELL